MTDKPHDALFRETFSKPEHAAAELRCVLPASVSEHIDWPSLALAPGSLVSELRAQRTDLLYEAKLRGGGDALLYLLFEHQSSNAPHMALRLLDYMVAVWKRFAREHGQARPLPVVVPVVLHHGERAWTAAVQFQDLFALGADEQAALGPFVPRFSYLLDDLTGQSAEALRERALPPLPKVALWCLARARQASFVEELGQWATLIEAAAGPEGRAIAAVMRYIVLVADVDQATVGQALAEGAGPRAEEAFMTLAERLIAEGMEKGLEKGRAEARTLAERLIAEGMEKGLEKGRAEARTLAERLIAEGIEKGIERGIERGREEGLQARREVLLKLLGLKFGGLDASVQGRVEGSGAAELDRWTIRTVRAESLAEVFEG